jgi:hypothetical protein
MDSERCPAVEMAGRAEWAEPAYKEAGGVELSYVHHRLAR